MADRRIVNPDGTVRRVPERPVSPRTQQMRRGDAFPVSQRNVPLRPMPRPTAQPQTSRPRMPQPVSPQQTNYRQTRPSVRPSWNSPDYIRDPAISPYYAQEPRKRPVTTYGEWQRNRYSSEYGRARAEQPDPRIRTASQLHIPIYESESSAAGRQMHIPIPPSAGGRYNHSSNPYYDRTAASRNTGEKARQIQKKLNPQVSEKPRHKNPVRADVERVRASRWAMPEGSPVYQQPRSPRPQNDVPRPQKKNRISKEQRAQIKAEKRRKRRYFEKAFLIRLGVIFLLCAGVFGFLYVRNFTTHTKKAAGVEYYVDVENGYSLSANSAQAYRSGSMYIDFSFLARSLNIASVGSVDSMRFIITDENSQDSAGTGRENYVIFNNGTRSASLNGTSITLDSECRASDTDFWVPFSFVENYMRGITSERDGDTIIIKASKEEEDKEGKIMIPKITFTMSKASPLEHVKAPSKAK